MIGVRLYIGINDKIYIMKSIIAFFLLVNCFSMNGQSGTGSIAIAANMSGVNINFKEV